MTRHFFILSPPRKHNDESSDDPGLTRPILAQYSGKEETLNVSLANNVISLV